MKPNHYALLRNALAEDAKNPGGFNEAQNAAWKAYDDALQLPTLRLSGTGSAAQDEANRKWNDACRRENKPTA
jgi:hypothetical protein